MSLWGFIKIIGREGFLVLPKMWREPITEKIKMLKFSLFVKRSPIRAYVTASEDKGFDSGINDFQG